VRRIALTSCLVVAAGALGWLAGGPAGRDATRRAIEIQELPAGGLGPPLGVELPELPPGPVGNVVLLLGDGMGLAHVQAARLAAFGPAGRFVFERFPVVGLAETSIAGSPIGESAASATALATGVATAHGRVGTAADGRPLRTLLEAARDAGLATGLVTTSAITDATPAAFAAHVEARRAEEEIAAQLAAARVDLLVGGGRERFLPLLAGGRRSDGRDLLAEAAARGVAVAASEAELAAAAALPLWALFPGRPDKAGAPPALALWTERALALLAAAAARRGTGFLLVVEEEAIDSAGHANRTETMARAVVRFDAAVAAAARRAAADGATLVVVTGDHSTGGLSIDFTSTATAVRVAWASAKHAGEPVPVYAYGPEDAAARFAGFSHQSEIGRRLAAALGLDLAANWSDAP
jgi:alkaline phosphatase